MSGVDAFEMVRTIADPEVDTETVVETWQAMVDGNIAWSVGEDFARKTLGMIDQGILLFGPVGTRTVMTDDKTGEPEWVVIPSRGELMPGSPGTIEYVTAKQAAIAAELDRWSFED